MNPGRRVVGIIQARMGSTRLPGKVLKDLAGEPTLTRVVHRVCRANMLDDVVVATTTASADEAIVQLCHRHGWPCFRGSEGDVLDRYYQAAMTYRADVPVRITSDCPLIEPDVVDKVVQTFIDRQPQVDYVCNVLFPRGLDTEVMRFDVLERAWREDLNPAWREHVTPYIYCNPDLFNIHHVVSEMDLSHVRWALDTPEDLAFMRQIYGYFGHDRFSWRDVLSLLEQNPQWLELNRHVKQKEILEAIKGENLVVRNIREEINGETDLGWRK
jgi:spore coat polysaccharide biosynthesis protein SpsF